MSFLKNVLRSAIAARREMARAESEPTPGESDGSQAGSSPAAAEPDAPPAWRLLGSQTGVQELQYADVARPGIQHLFRHQPRRILDIGCATGAVCAGLKASVPGLWAWGCELNPEAAQVAAGRLDHVTNVPRAEWSAADLGLVDSLDTVLLLDVLEHMYNPWAELEFLGRRLPADAQVIVSLPNVGHISVLEALSQGRFLYQPTGILDVTHVRFFTCAEMEAMFEQTGFTIEGTWILSRSPNVDIKEFPAQVAAGKMVLNVDTPEEWEGLNAIQFGFRLRPSV